MAIGQTIRLELEDETAVEATYDGRDIRAWEAKTGRTALGVPMTLSMLTYFGWSAAKRQGTLNGAYDRYEAFDAVCIAVTNGASQPEPDQEPPDPSPPPSPDTPSEASDG